MKHAGIYTFEFWLLIAHPANNSVFSPLVESSGGAFYLSGILIVLLLQINQIIM